MRITLLPQGAALRHQGLGQVVRAAAAHAAGDAAGPLPAGAPLPEADAAGREWVFLALCMLVLVLKLVELGALEK